MGRQCRGEKGSGSRACQWPPRGKLSCSTTAAGGSASAACTAARRFAQLGRNRGACGASQPASSAESLPARARPSNCTGCTCEAAAGQQVCLPLIVAPALHA